ncbi:MAG: lantibiotic dehydratase [Pirellulales bacterium]|nr:lantibiotic dehydratase [Pirellulales bacterium]
MTEKPTLAERFEPAKFFVMRSPLLPFDLVTKWHEGGGAEASDEPTCESLRQWLRAMFARPDVCEALFLASPSLHESFSDWRDAPDSPRGRKAEPALIRYFTRMAGRATPFGLFAGCSVGRIGGNSETNTLSIAPSSEYRRHVRLDMEYLSSLVAEIQRHPDVRRELVFRPNSSLYRVADRWRYAEARGAGQSRSYQLVAIDACPYLQAVLDRAATGGTPAELAEALTAHEIESEDALAFVNELIDSQILTSDLEPAVTGGDPLEALVLRLASIPAAAPYLEILRSVHETIATLCQRPLGEPRTSYEALAQTLQALPVTADLGRLLQTDMHKPASGAVLNTDVTDELLRGVEVLLSQIEKSDSDLLASFRRSFVERYGDRELPLVEVLDDELGIGFERSQSPAAAAAPLLAGITFPQRGSSTAFWTSRHSVLLQKLAHVLASGSREMKLDNADLRALATAEPATAPAAFATFGSVAAQSPEALAAGDFQVVLQYAAGPSGARALGRFCQGDEELTREVVAHLSAEEQLEPEAIYAEVVHLPEGRLGNVLLRPLLRNYEIPFLGRSAAPVEQQIPVTDLRVSVVGDRVVLRSAALNREIRPRLTTAHNFAWHSMGLYQFLCTLQNQHDCGAIAWSWGPLDAAPFLPRVVVGRVVLARARWLVTAQEIRSLVDADADQLVATVAAWRVARNLPRWVSLQDGDNELPVDLENQLSIAALVDLLRQRQTIALVEIFPSPDELCAAGPEGRYVHELVVPFVARAAVAAPQVADNQPTRYAISPQGAPAGEGEIPFEFAPGSEWLYAKVYGGAATADRVLVEHLQPVLEHLSSRGLIEQWFFIRYADPDEHLRLRIQAKPNLLQHEVWPVVRDALAAARAAGLVGRVQLDTYQREVRRYGGPIGVQLAENWFAADSRAAVEVIAATPGGAGQDLRWRLALVGLDRLLEDLGFDLTAKARVARQARDGFAAEFRVDTNLRQQLSQKFRTERNLLVALLAAQAETGANAAELESVIAALISRSHKTRPIAQAYRHLAERGELGCTLEELALSLMHMWVNRVARAAHRAQEVVLYDFLDRLYHSQLARASGNERRPVAATA